MDKLRIALVGAGRRGAGTYLPIISKMDDDLELVAVCDVKEEQARNAAEKYGVPHFADIGAMVESAKPDIAAVVITPSRNHEAGICAHFSNEKIRFQTCWAWIAQAVDRIIHVCQGSPCKNEYKTHSY